MVAFRGTPRTRKCSERVSWFVLFPYIVLKSYRFCLNVGWLYTHLVAANSGISVKLAPSLSQTARAAVDGAVTSIPKRTNDESGGSLDTLSESAPLLPVSAAAQINESVRTFMAM